MAKSLFRKGLEGIRDSFSSQKSWLDEGLKDVEKLDIAYRKNFKVKQYSLEFKEKAENFNNSTGLAKVGALGSVALKTAQFPLFAFAQTKSRFSAGETYCQYKRDDIGILYDKQNDKINKKLRDLPITFSNASSKFLANQLEQNKDLNLINIKEKLSLIKSSQEITKQRIEQIDEKLKSKIAPFVADNIKTEKELLQDKLKHLEERKEHYLNQISEDLIKERESILNAEKAEKTKLEERKNAIEEEQKKAFFKKPVLAISTFFNQRKLNKIIKNENENGELDDRIKTEKEDAELFKSKDGKNAFFANIKTKSNFSSVIYSELDSLSSRMNSSNKFADLLNRDFKKDLKESLKEPYTESKHLKESFKELYRESKLISSLETQIKELGKSKNKEKHIEAERKVGVLLFDMKHPNMPKNDIVKDMVRIDEELVAKGEKPIFQNLDEGKLYTDPNQLELVVLYKMLKLKEENEKANSPAVSIITPEEPSLAKPNTVIIGTGEEEKRETLKPNKIIIGTDEKNPKETHTKKLLEERHENENTIKLINM